MGRMCGFRTTTTDESGVLSSFVEPRRRLIHASGGSSREDLLSEQAPSRATVREIPVLRTSSTAPTVQLLEYKMPGLSGYHHGDVQDEYYRREVMTRTIITRSTEALSQQPPLGRSSPIEGYITSSDPNTREERTVDYKVKYHRDIEEQERRIREQQERRRKEEEDRRRRDEESRRAWEMREMEILERLRLDRERKQKVLENSVFERERLEKERIERDRLEREKAEMQRRAEWERMENERRGLEEEELARRRQLENERLERERAEAERLERIRLEREREQMERERLEEERREQERLEMERIERERIERERIEIERIERIKRERIEREQREREKEREEQERLRLEREELERLERERRELEIRERELAEMARKEAIEREKQRLADEAREARRREEERREADLLADIQRQASERERLRKMQEREEKERLERIRREQQRLEMERAEAERREKERMEDERREKELLEAQLRQKEQRERERLADIERESKLQEEEMREKARREAERRAAAERERKRREDEERERLNLYELERAAANRKVQRQVDLEREREREELDRKAFEIAEMERKANERREMERLEEERSLAELREKERRNQEIRDRERREMEERAAARQREDRRSRDKLDHIVRERTEKERFEAEKRRLLAEKEAMSKKRQYLTSSETLQKLTRPPYFSRENLSNPEFTTKVERQVIERVDRNVWVDDVRIPSQQTVSYSLDSTNEENIRDRVYNPNDLSRNGSTRTSRYRAKMEKARREFIAGGSESSDPVAERFRRSQEDLMQRARPEYRGPLLQKFHDSEFKSKTDLDGVPYARVGPSPYGQEFERLLEETERKYAAYRMRMSQPNLYSRSRNWSTSYLETDVDTGKPEFTATTRQVEETNLDDVHQRSGSVVDYQRQSRRDQVDEATDAAHSRSRSADYLMDKRTREETIPPENELQKSIGDSMIRSSRISDHEMRFRKSTEKLTVPDWYRENRTTTARPTDVDLTLPRPALAPHSNGHQVDHSQQSRHDTVSSHGYRRAPSSAGIEFPKGMFDRYKDEIEDLRRSRSSLHQIAQQDHRQEVKPTAPPRRSLSQEVISSARPVDSVAVSGQSNRALPGYTVSSVPTGWNIGEESRNRHSRVIEVADTFAGPKWQQEQQEAEGEAGQRYGGRVTVEEVLDSIFKRSPSTSAPVADQSLPLHADEQIGNENGPGIYSRNYMLMEQVMKRPSKAESLLKSELLFVRCSFCHKTRELVAARMQYVSCKHCYSYYCTRACRLKDWPKHSHGCSFARINTLCKDVIMKVREDPEAQACMSRVARNGYTTSGRGSVNIRLSSPQLAQAYVTNGWSSLSMIPQQQLLHYYTIAALLQECKEPSLIALCRRYDPSEKFILSVSIIADIEYCPQTPPPEIAEWSQSEPKDVFQPTTVTSALTPDLYGQLVMVPTDV
ncbi:unnamed protein product [Nippostrongylus brasiliensis]|uniref:MYND-type domain-containing protein n=1 Tax=Nippostrongylus brasiliensis TaxID=27835 RepID=A0A158R1Q7_NIPBR|nr:unnamed protein product [Nippostrongylus brasiliensis]